MGDQFQELLVEVARELSGTTQQVQSAVRRMEELAREHGDMRERLASLERESSIDIRHGEDEHGRLRKRLEDGDVEFRTLRDQAAAAKKAAESAKASLVELRKALDEAHKKERGTSIKTWQRKVIDHAIGAIVPLIVSGAIWLVYHLYIAAKLAEAAMKAKGGNP